MTDHDCTNSPRCGLVLTDSLGIIVVADTVMNATEVSKRDATMAAYGDPSILPLVDLRSVLDGMSEGFALLDRNFCMIDINAEALRQETRPRGELIGRSHWELYPGSEHGPIGQAYKRAMREHVPVTLEHKYTWADNRTAWLDMRAYPTADGNLAIFFRDVTDRHETEKKLSESEARFRGAVDAFADVLWTNDAHGCMRGEQSGWAALTGQSYEEYQDYGWATAVHPDDKQPTIDAWKAALASDSKLFAFEHRVRRYDGVWRRFAIRAVPVYNEDGLVREWVGVHQDITEIRENEMRFQQVADNISSVIYVHEIEEERISYVNKQYENIWQQPASAVFADMRAFMRDVHPDDLPTVQSALQRQLSGENTEIRYRLVRKDGTFCYIYDRAYVTVDPYTGAPRVVGIAEDVTLSTEVRLLLARNMETFETLVRDNPFGLYVIDSDFRLLQISQGATSVFAYIEPLIGRDFAEILRIVWQEPFATEAIGHFKNTLATGNSYVSLKVVEARANIVDTEAYDWRIDRIVLPDGSYGVVCYFYDLSERMALEASLQTALSDKELLMKEIDHRMRNSLSMVSALLTMQSNISESVEAKHALKVAVSRMQAVARIHERLYKGEQVGVVRFDTYLEEICRDMQESLKQESIVLKLDAVHIDLPVDQAMPLGLITNELVTNAYKYCGAGNVTISIALSVEDNILALTVSDTGVGLPADFSPMSRKGLGMQVVKLLTRQLGGSLVTPTAGDVATFVIKVALKPVENGSAQL